MIKPGWPNSYSQLGMLAQDRWDYGQAERRYQQSLQIDERLGNQAGMATSWGLLGNLAMERQRYAEATVWYIPALLVWLRLQVPQVAYGAQGLAALRAHMGSDAFVAAASTVVDNTQLAKIQAVLDTLPTDDSGGPEAE